MYRKRAIAGGGVVAVILVGSTMLAWANGAFGTPAVDRVGSFRTIETQLAPMPHPTSTTTSRRSSRVVPRTSRPGELAEPTRPASSTSSTSDGSNVATTPEPNVEPTRPPDTATVSVDQVPPPTVAHVTSSSRARPRPVDDVEPSAGLVRDD